MQKIIFILCCFASSIAFGQNAKVEFDAKTWQPPYTLAKPEGWDVERFPIPISFAPSVPYSGVEDIRFTPGWAKIKTSEYWSYTFLWYLDGLQEINKKIIEENLKAYYSGLLKVNTDPKKVPADKLTPAKTSFKKAATSGSDLQTYTGTVEMIDYMQQKPITLNCIIHIKADKEKNKTFVFHELSPQPFTDDVWLSLNKLWAEFTY